MGSPSEFYLELKDLSLDCKLETMEKESLLGHLLLRGHLPAEEKLQEWIIVDTKGQELKDDNFSSLIASSEMYRSSSKKRGPSGQSRVQNRRRRE